MRLDVCSILVCVGYCFLCVVCFVRVWSVWLRWCVSGLCNKSQCIVLCLYCLYFCMFIANTISDHMEVKVYFSMCNVCFDWVLNACCMRLFDLIQTTKVMHLHFFNVTSHIIAFINIFLLLKYMTFFQAKNGRVILKLCKAESTTWQGHAEHFCFKWFVCRLLQRTLNSAF